MLQELEKEVSKEKINKLHFYSILIQILDKYIGVVNERKHLQIKSKIHAKDIDKLFKIRKILLIDICSIPSVNYLAQEAGMNKSKLQKSFKQIFGKSIFQYALYYKIEEANKMLNSQEYSISEIGYMLGYSNLSHFSEYFKKHFGVTPGRLLSSLKNET